MIKHLCTFLLFAGFAAAIWPLPSNYTSGTTTLWIRKDVQFRFNCGGDQVGYASDRWHQRLHVGLVPGLLLMGSTSQSGQYANGSPGSAGYCSSTTLNIVQAAVERTYATIFSQNFVPWQFHPRDADFEPLTENETYIGAITLEQTSADPENILRPRAGDIDESYSLEVTEEGEVTITAATSIGLVRGLTTLTQLFFSHSEGGAYTSLAPVKIEDAPKFVHRGLNLDVSRHFFPVEDIKRTIDALAYSKMNRFHLHATDSQSWPLEIPEMPGLAANGAYRPDLTYSPADIKDIQLYGAMQGVQVYVEIDMPGHTASIWFTYPELIAAFNIQPDWATYAAQPPSGTFKLNSTAVDDFLDKLLGSLLPRLHPYSAYFHTGGDEVNKNAYLFDETVRSNDSSVLQPLMQRFIDLNHERVRAAGMTPVVWEEMLLNWNLTLGEDVIVQTWQSDEAVAQTVAKGHKVLVGNYNRWYLDCGHGAWLDFQSSTSEEYWPYPDYCSPRKNWRLMYSYDPLSGVPEESADLVLGGECHLWAEQTDSANLDRNIWPRAAVAGEVLWSGAKDAEGNNRTHVQASPRLAEFRERLLARGVQAEPVHMPFCTQNGTQCAYIGGHE